MNTAASMQDEIFVDKKGAKTSLHSGTYFYATDAYKRTYAYQYLGIQPDECGYDYHLYNETLGTFANVNASWFSERYIKLI